MDILDRGFWNLDLKSETPPAFPIQNPQSQIQNRACNSNAIASRPAPAAPLSVDPFAHFGERLGA
jgi:hypothetical protein